MKNIQFVRAVLVSMIGVFPGAGHCESAWDVLRSNAGKLGIDAQLIAVPAVPVPAAPKPLAGPLAKEALVGAIKEASARAGEGCSRHWRCLDEIPAAVKMVEFHTISAYAATWHRLMDLGYKPALPVGMDKFHVILPLVPTRHTAVDARTKQPIGHRFRFVLGTGYERSMFTMTYFTDFYYSPDGTLVEIEVRDYYSRNVRSFPLEALPPGMAKDL